MILTVRIASKRHTHDASEDTSKLLISLIFTSTGARKKSVASGASGGRNPGDQIGELGDDACRRGGLGILGRGHDRATEAELLRLAQTGWSMAHGTDGAGQAY